MEKIRNKGLEILTQEQLNNLKNTEQLVEGRIYGVKDESSSNPNLLINGDFRVNQRGQTLYENNKTTLKYTVDRWGLGGGNNATQMSSVTVNDGYLSLSFNQQYRALYQIVEDYKALRGKTITFSAKLSNVVGPIRLQINDGVGSVVKDFSSDGVHYVTHTVANHAARLIVLIQNGLGGTVSCNVEWAKLEIGSAATPFIPKPYAQELLACQRYYQIRSNIYTIESKAIDRPIPMRVDGTIGTTVISETTYNTVDAEIYDV